jgi:hypothetical protein
MQSPLTRMRKSARYQRRRYIATRYLIPRLVLPNNDELTSSRSVYKTRMRIKVNFDNLFLLTNYELYIIKIILLETSYKYESNDIIL